MKYYNSEETKLPVEIPPTIPVFSLGMKNNIFLIKFSLCSALLFFASATKADQFYMTAGFKCDGKNPELTN